RFHRRRPGPAVSSCLQSASERPPGPLRVSSTEQAARNKDGAAAVVWHQRQCTPYAALGKALNGCCSPAAGVSFPTFRRNQTRSKCVLSQCRAFVQSTGMYPMKSSPAVAVEHVSKSYGSFRAVKDLTFEIVPGEIFALLG